MADIGDLIDELIGKASVETDLIKFAQEIRKRGDNGRSFAYQTYNTFDNVDDIIEEVYKADIDENVIAEVITEGENRTWSSRERKNWVESLASLSQAPVSETLEALANKGLIPEKYLPDRDITAKAVYEGVTGKVLDSPQNLTDSFTTFETENITDTLVTISELGDNEFGNLTETLDFITGLSRESNIGGSSEFYNVAEFIEGVAGREIPIDFIPDLEIDEDDLDLLSTGFVYQSITDEELNNQTDADGFPTPQERFIDMFGMLGDSSPEGELGGSIPIWHMLTNIVDNKEIPEGLIPNIERYMLAEPYSDVRVIDILESATDFISSGNVESIMDVLVTLGNDYSGDLDKLLDFFIDVIEDDLEWMLEEDFTQIFVHEVLTGEDEEHFDRWIQNVQDLGDTELFNFIGYVVDDNFWEYLDEKVYDTLLDEVSSDMLSATYFNDIPNLIHNSITGEYNTASQTSKWVDTVYNLGADRVYNLVSGVAEHGLWEHFSEEVGWSITNSMDEWLGKFAEGGAFDDIFAGISDNWLDLESQLEDIESTFGETFENFQESIQFMGDLIYNMLNVVPAWISMVLDLHYNEDVSLDTALFSATVSLFSENDDIFYSGGYIDLSTDLSFGFKDLTQYEPFFEMYKEWGSIQVKDIVWSVGLEVPPAKYEKVTRNIMIPNLSETAETSFMIDKSLVQELQNTISSLEKLYQLRELESFTGL